jgi:hypothetical protein
MKKFFSTILPYHGVYFIIGKTGQGLIHYPYQSITGMAVAGLQLDAHGYDVFFACASYHRASYIDVGGKRRQRTAKNAGWVQSFWLDIDCGPDKVEADKGCATINDALAALLAFVDAVGLPKPTVVFSGGGLHVYFLLTETITKEQWQPVAKLLKDLTQCSAIRLLADDSRTSDIASILRPIGTHNYKPERNCAVVTQRIDGEPIDFGLFSQIISKAHHTHCVGVTRPRTGIQMGMAQTAPGPETPENIARVKSALAAINPDCEYPLWRDTCFAVHAFGWSCSKELARSWSKGAFI